MDSRNFAIGVLSTTAVMLLVGLVVVHSRPAPVQARGMTLVAGEYVLTVGSLDQVDEDLLYVVDNGESKLVTYRFDGIGNRIEVVSGVDLDEIRKMAAPAGGSQPGRPRRP